MKSIKKIQAFTLSEMIVVLMLTAIVVGLAFTVLSLVQRQMFGIKSNFQANTELRLLEQSLWLDFNRYNYVIYNDIENTLKFNTEIDSSTYQFQEKRVIKGIDTFNVPINLKVFYFNGAATKNGKIDAVKLEASNELQSKRLFAFKVNDANIFMN